MQALLFRAVSVICSLPLVLALAFVAEAQSPASDATVSNGQTTDETKRNPETVMPPFGRNLILNEKEISAIVDFLYTL